MKRENHDSDRTTTLRAALGQFSTGIAIVTALDREQQPVGMTINSFSSVSLTPALVSWCIDRRAASYSTFTRAARFALSVLAGVVRFRRTTGAGVTRTVEDRRG